MVSTTFLFLAHAATHVHVLAAPPVVLVPGLIGSGLEAKLTHARMPHFECKTDTHGQWMRTWVQVLQLIPVSKDCLIDRLTLIYNATDDSYSNLQGVQLRPVDFAGIGGIDKLDPSVPGTEEFDVMIKSLQTALGYQVGKNLFGAPYDWRLAGDSHARVTHGVGGYYAELQQLVEHAVQTNGEKAVVVSHSLGCPTMLYFFHNFVTEEWRAAHIRGWVALAGPWLGSVQQASSYLGGNTLGMPSWLVPHDYVKPVQVNASSGVWLSPHQSVFDDTIITTPSRNYTAAEIPNLISIIGKEAGGEQAQALFAKTSLDLSLIQKAPTNVPLDNWYSSGVATAERFIYDREIEHGFNRAPVTTVTGDGDGTVNSVSLKQPEKWLDQGGSSVKNREFPGANHFAMLTDERVLKALIDYLSPASSPSVIV